MTSIKHIRNLAFASLAFAISLVSACKKDAAESILTVPATTTLESFGPTGALHGDTLSIIGYHLDRVTQVDLTGASVPAASFISKSAELINIIIPTETVPGYITLKSSDGDIVSKTILNLQVMPTITSITAESRPGSNISIKGDHLNWVTSVTFAKGLVESTFVSQSISEIVVKVPDNAESGKLLINYSGTKPGEFETTNSLTVTLPVATSFAPNPVKHQTDLTINGTNLDLVKKISLPGVSAALTSFISQSATQIVVQVPSETVSGKVTLYPASNVPSVSSTDMNITYPAITTMAPNPVAIGSNLTITGTNLDIAKSVAFQGVATPVTSFVSQSATSLVVAVPVGSINGKITLGIINTDQTVLSESPLNIVGYVVPVGPVFPIYEDGITSNWNGWIGGGWGGTVTLDNPSPVKRGTASAKISYVGDWGVPLQLGGANISLAPYTTFRVSIYGGPGSNGKEVFIQFNEHVSEGKAVTIVEGAWTDFDIPLGQISSATTLSFLYLKKWGGTSDYTIYVDDMGLN